MSDDKELVYSSESLSIRRDVYKTSNKVIINKDFVEHPGSVLIIGNWGDKILISSHVRNNLFWITPSRRIFF